MKTLKLLLTLFFFGSCAFAQGLEDQSWDFGEVKTWKNDTAWFKIRNAGQKDMVFLPVFYNEKFKVLFSNRAIESGQTADVGIVYYTETKGKFEVVVPIYVNIKSDPINFKLKGNIKGFDPYAQLRCPSVNEGPVVSNPDKVVTIEVRDAQTNEKLNPDYLSVKTRDNKKVELEKAGTEYEMTVPPGAYRVIAGKKHYEEYLALINLQPYQTSFIVYLDKKTQETIEEPVIAIQKTDSSEKERRKNRDIASTDDTTGIFLADDIPDKHKHPDTTAVKLTGSLGNEYKINNIILIVDVSASMNRNGKLDNLKNSFVTLIDAFRNEDYIGVITMATEASMIQPVSPVTDKDSLKARVIGMKGTGSTNGGAALSMAYKMAKESFVAGGNNQIIIATDGLFYGGGMGRRDMEKMIQTGAAEGINLSCISLGADEKAQLFLSNLANMGNGAFIRVDSSVDGQNAILNMVKNQSLKHAE